MFDKESYGEILKTIEAKPAYLIKINYKSGHHEQFWFHDFKIKGTDYNWTVGSPVSRPLAIGVNNIESIHQIDFVYDFKKFFIKQNGNV